MAKVDYDPVHGKNMPTAPDPADAEPVTDAAPAPQAKNPPQ
jgi:hypothetical protein